MCCVETQRQWRGTLLIVIPNCPITKLVSKRLDARSTHAFPVSYSTIAVGLVPGAIFPCDDAMDSPGQLQHHERARELREFVSSNFNSLYRQARRLNTILSKSIVVSIRPKYLCGGWAQLGLRGFGSTSKFTSRKKVRFAVGLCKPWVWSMRSIDVVKDLCHD